MRRVAAFALPLFGCSDYGLNEESKPVPVDDPAIEVDPAAVTATGLCAPTERDVLVKNGGEGVLTVASLEVRGAGWSITSAPALPIRLEQGESTLVGLEGTDGDGKLVVGSDDPEDPALEVPLRAVANTPPSVSIVSPTAGEVFAEGADAVLYGVVADAEEAAEDLAITWTASVDGELSRGPPAADGSTSVAWAAADRSSGPQEVTLSAVDACGEEAVATVGTCQDGAFAYDALALSSWHYEGAAGWDAGAGNLLLTPATTDQVGTAFETSTRVGGGSVDIQFYVYMGGGTGADGISLTALDAAAATTFLGGTGCGIGYGGDASCTAGPALPGWSIELDTYDNGGVDPTSLDHVAFTFDGDVDAYRAWAVLPEMEDTGWHAIEVSIVAPRVTVSVDGTAYIDEDIVGDYAFDAWIGFTAATGGETNEHRIDELTVTDYACD